MSGGAKVKRPLRVAFDHRIFVYQQHGGVSRYFCGLAEHLPTFGVTPKVIAPFFVTDRLRDLPRDRLWGRHIAPDARRQRAAQVFSEATHAPLARAFGARIVHETYYGARRAAPANARLVLTVYDMIHELFPELFPRDTTYARKAAAIARADAILCISESTRTDLLRLFPEAAAKTSVTLLGFDARFAQGGAVEAPASRPYILFVGARGGYKNFAGLLDAYAASRLPTEGIALNCVGGGAFDSEERARIGHLGLGDHVAQLAADDAQLGTLYRGALLYACPSLYEGFGIPPLEAMAAGCPVVAMRSSSLPEVCGDAAEYAEPGAVDTLTLALERVALSPERAAQLRAAGHERTKRFSWRACAAATAAVYQQLA